MDEYSLIERQLIKHEGFSAKPYRCTADKLTIGYGRNLDDRGITKDEALHLLANDIQVCEIDLSNLLGDMYWRLSLDRQAALLDMRYNLGARGFRRFRKMIKALRNRNYFLAAQEIKNSEWYKQVGTRGRDIYNQMLGDKK